MRSKRIVRTRHYCDHCEKHGKLRGFWQKPAAIKHESGCFLNPDRICRFCLAAVPPLTQKPIAELTASIGFDKDTFGMKELRELCGNCPGCIGAAIEQGEIGKSNREWGSSSEEFMPWQKLGFDFIAEMKAFWQVVDEAREHYDF